MNITEHRLKQEADVYGYDNDAENTRGSFR